MMRISIRGGNKLIWMGKTHAEVHNTMVLFLIVQQAVIPTNVLPAPQGSTMMPDRARLLRERKVRKMMISI